VSESRFRFIEKIRIWIYWQIVWSGFVNVVECDVIVVCLCGDVSLTPFYY